MCDQGKKDCLQKFEQYAIPMFKKVAEHNGVKWPDVTAAKVETESNADPKEEKAKKVAKKKPSAKKPRPQTE